jgi:hypothetical protein
MIHVTDQLLEDLYEAQRVHLIHTLETNRNGDDGGDYITSAVDVFQALQTMSCDQSDTLALSVMLNAKPSYDVDFIPYLAYDPTDDNPYPPVLTVVNLAICASDGICDAIYSLNPPVLKEVTP